MKANEAPFLDLLGIAKMQFVIPVYQRVYSWSEKECEVLWNDIIRAGKTGNPHFVGSVLYIPESDSTMTGIKKMLLIDGQQRMTTLSLIISALVEYLEEDASRASFLTDIKVSSLRKSYLFNDDDYVGDARYKLILSADDKATLFAIAGDGAMPDDRSNLIVGNYEFFKGRIRAKNFDPKTLWAGLNNIQIIDTKLDAAIDNAQVIFESMNSKGKPLTPIDLIRNYILMSLPSTQQAKLYDHYWRPIELLFGRSSDDEFNAFVWYWLWLKVPTRKPREDEAYYEFKRYREEEFDGTTEELLAELLAYAKRYASLFLGKEKDSVLAERFGYINALEVKPIRPLLLALYALYEKDRLSKGGLQELCTTIESFLFRRAVCGRFTTGLNNFFAGMYRELEKQADVVTYVTAMLMIHDEGMTAYFPTDEDFIGQLQTRDLYNRFSKTRFCLGRLENWHHPKEPISWDAYQIEHVLPRSIENSQEWQLALGLDWADKHSTYCNTLGNLTFTGYNQEYSNRPFKDKLELPDTGFLCSPLYLNKSIANKNAWTESSIQDRARMLAEESLKIWPYPKLSKETVEAFKPKKARADGDEWTIEVDHPELTGDGACAELFEAFSDAVLQDNPTWEQYVKKYYVGFRSGKRKLHAIVEGRTSKGGWLAIGLAKTVDELDDPLDLCEDKRLQQGFGPGMPTYLSLHSVNDIPSAMALINQC